MYIRRRGANVEVWAPAKLNLFLEVLGKRPDGYHELESLLVPVGLFDTLFFAAGPDRAVTFSCERALGQRAWQVSVVPEDAESALGDLPTGGDNLAARAVALLKERSGTTRGARVRLVKRIPSASGWGGASSDAAAALIAANAGWELGWSKEQLMALAAELGSDVPFFFSPRAAVLRGRGERVEPLPVSPRLELVMARPPRGLSTRDVYAKCRPAERPVSMEPMIEAFTRRRADEVGRLLFNRLEEAAGELSPWIARLRATFGDCGCLGHGMSGSGTGYFGICRHAGHARRVAQRLRGREVGSVFCASTFYFARQRLSVANPN
jgi:4-diphosphocytidyl-2-C-methyl-D-erythritol kinase